MKHYRMLIGGDLVDSCGGSRRESVDPGSREVVATYAYADKSDARHAVEAASASFGKRGLARHATGRPRPGHDGPE